MTGKYDDPNSIAARATLRGDESDATTPSDRMRLSTAFGDVPPAQSVTNHQARAAELQMQQGSGVFRAQMVSFQVGDQNISGALSGTNLVTTDGHKYLVQAGEDGQYSLERVNCPGQSREPALEASLTLKPNTFSFDAAPTTPVRTDAAPTTPTLTVPTDAAPTTQTLHVPTDSTGTSLTLPLPTDATATSPTLPLPTDATAATPTLPLPVTTEANAVKPAVADTNSRPVTVHIDAPSVFTTVSDKLAAPIRNPVDVVVSVPGTAPVALPGSVPVGAPATLPEAVLGTVHAAVPGAASGAVNGTAPGAPCRELSPTLREPLNIPAALQPLLSGNAQSAEANRPLDGLTPLPIRSLTAADVIAGASPERLPASSLVSPAGPERLVVPTLINAIPPAEAALLTSMRSDLPGRDSNPLTADGAKNPLSGLELSTTENRRLVGEAIELLQTLKNAKIDTFDPRTLSLGELTKGQEPSRSDKLQDFFIQNTEGTKIIPVDQMLTKLLTLLAAQPEPGTKSSAINSTDASTTKELATNTLSNANVPLTLHTASPQNIHTTADGMLSSSRIGAKLEDPVDSAPTNKTQQPHIAPTTEKVEVTFGTRTESVKVDLEVIAATRRENPKVDLDFIPVTRPEAVKVDLDVVAANRGDILRGHTVPTTRPEAVSVDLENLGDKKKRDREEDQRVQEESVRQQSAFAAIMQQRKLRELKENALKEQEKIAQKDKKDEDNKRRRYTIRLGDTLQSIATRQLRDVRLTSLIHSINRIAIPSELKNGQQVYLIHAGQVIWLPSHNEVTRALTTMPREHMAANTQSTTEELESRFGANWGGAASTEKIRSNSLRGSENPEEIQRKRRNIEALLGKLSSHETTAEHIQYRVRLGDTLKSVALNHPAMSDVSLWKLLARLNDMSLHTDAKGCPLQKLVRGTTLVIPTATEIHEHRSANPAILVPALSSTSTRYPF